MALPVFAGQARIDLGIGDLRRRHMAPLADKGLNLRRPFFGNEPLDERAGVQIVHPVPHNAPHMGAGMNVLNFPEEKRPEPRT